eukprot:3679560-Pyramimonas_sp.AAC.1
MTHAKRLPPKAVSGRWGSFSAVEKRLLATEGRLTSVMEAVFGCGQVQPEALPLKDKEDFSDPREDSQAAYRKQMG